MDKISFSVLCSGCCGLVFCIPAIIFYPDDIKRITFVFFAGLFVGLVAAPEIKPKLYRNVAFFQTASGALGGVLAAIAFHPKTDVAIFGFLLGGILGWLGPYWLKHITLP